MRPDAARYIRPDAARFLRPGTDPADVYPALERKYPGQPRRPEGQQGGGQYSFDRRDGSTSDDGRARVYITKPDVTSDTLLTGDGDGEEDDGGDLSGIQLAGDLPDGLGSDLDTPGDDPPQIPRRKPSKSWQVTRALRAVSNWLGRRAAVTGEVYGALSDFADWLQVYEDLIRANQDPPKTLQELMDGVGKGRPGYDDHHIIEKTAAEYWGLSRSEINDPSNLVSIPRLKHYQITGWYMKSNRDFGGLSPREYLRDKGPEERRRVGLLALILMEVLKP